MLNTLEVKCALLEEECIESTAAAESEVEKIKNTSKRELDDSQIQCLKFKSDLQEMSEFADRKEALEEELVNCKATLARREIEYKNTVHNLERKVLQDKNRMKREMLQKLNEAVANFRRVADQQMAETTKRAIRENIAITTQIRKMSSKLIELVAENDVLTGKVNASAIETGLLVESEKDLVKKNIANQKVIKMLVERLKGTNLLNTEGDQMLEMAFEAEQVMRESEEEERSRLQEKVITDEMKHVRID